MGNIEIGSSQVRQILESRPRINQLAYFAFGSLTTLSFAPFGLYILMPVLLMPLMFVWVCLPPRNAA